MMVATEPSHAQLNGLNAGRERRAKNTILATDLHISFPLHPMLPYAPSPECDQQVKLRIMREHPASSFPILACSHGPFD